MLDNGHLLDQVLKRSGNMQRIVHKELGIILRKKCCWNSKKADILSSVQRLHGPEVRSRARSEENCLYTSLQIKIQLYDLSNILTVNQLSVFGAVAAICEEFEDHQDRTGQLVILVGQSIVLVEVKAEAPLHDEDPMNDQIIGSNTFNKLNRFHQKTD